MKTVFEYLDYREFMKDHYAWSKIQHQFFSFRYIEQKTGVNASYYVKVINKQKHISAQSLPGLISFFKFNKRETDYFTNLVNYCKAKKKDQVDYYFNKLFSFRDPAVKSLEERKFRYFKQWYTVVIRELLRVLPYQGDYHELARRIEPPISAVQARQSITLLEELNLVKRDTDGTFKVTDQFLTTETILKSKAVRDFQKEMIRLAGESIDRFDKENRDISSLTVSTSRACLDLIRERLDRTRKEILQLIAEHDDEPEEVYQLNFQIFPVTKKRNVTGKKNGVGE